MAFVLPTPEELAKFFHEKYERLALEMGYETRAESRRAWEDVPEKNRALMIATAKEVLSWIGFGIDRAMLEANPATATLPMGKPAPDASRMYVTKRGAETLLRAWGKAGATHPARVTLIPNRADPRVEDLFRKAEAFLNTPGEKVEEELREALKACDVQGLWVTGPPKRGEEEEANP